MTPDSSPSYIVATSSTTELSDLDIARLCAIIAAGGAVDLKSASEELLRAKVLVVVRTEKQLVAVGAIKRIRSKYAKKISESGKYFVDPAIHARLRSCR